MTLQQLRYAVTIADMKSMNKAASELFVSQPALSNTIHDLEEELQIEIFLRTNRGIVVTTEGEEFLSYARQMVELQQMMEESNIGPKKKDAWLAFGIALCVIFANEVDGMEWRTLVDGNREAPILLNTSTGEWIDPMKLVWSKVKAGGKVNLPEIYSSLF